MVLDIDTINRLVNTHVQDAIPQEHLNEFKASGLFEDVDIPNLRDAGKVPGSRIPLGRVYRSGTLANADDQAKIWLSENVDCIFDFRRLDGTEGPEDDIEGVKSVNLELRPGDYTKIQLKDYVTEDYALDSWRTQYMEIANGCAPIFRANLEYIRDNPGKSTLSHCFAGRDRTGVFLGLVHHLAGSDPEVARLDYMLSRVGCEFKREDMIKYAMFMLKTRNPHIPGFYNVIQLRGECWDAFVEALSEKYGGWDGYVTSPDGLNFSDKDLEKIKESLRFQPANRNTSPGAFNLCKQDPEEIADGQETPRSNCSASSGAFNLCTQHPEDIADGQTTPTPTGE